MKKFIIAAGIILLMLLTNVSLALNETKVTAYIGIYSGRAPVEWQMTAQEIDELKVLLQDLPETGPAEVPEYGIISVTSEAVSKDFPYTGMYLFNGLVVTDDGTEKKFYKDDEGIAEWLIDLGNEHDPNYVPPPYETLPPGTAKIAVIPSYFDETVARDEVLVKTLTVFSEGNAPLEGEIVAPEFITLAKDTFALPAIEAGEDFLLTVDTSKVGERTGDIVIKSNDPSEGGLRVPFTLTVTGVDDAKEGNETGGVPEPGKQVDYTVYMIAFFAVLVVCFLVYRRLQAGQIEKEREEFRRWKEEHG